MRALAATLESLQADANVVFVAGAPNFGRSLMVVDTRVAAGNGRDSLPVMVRLVDDFNNPVTDYLLTMISTPPAQASILPAAPPTPPAR